MSYVHFGTNSFPREALGCGPGCPCRPCRSAAAQSGQLLAQGTANLGNLGWDTFFHPIVRKQGHEILTRIALGNGLIEFRVGSQRKVQRLSAREMLQIIIGNADTDIQYLRRLQMVAPIAPVPTAAVAAALPFREEDQKHHALRGRYDLPWEQGLTAIIADLRAQHGNILAESNWTRKLRRIGQALHLIQDSYCPAHTDRDDSGDPARWCIKYIRHFGRGGHYPREHGIPDIRDHLDLPENKEQNEKQKKHADQAVLASRSYLQIVFKAIYGLTMPDPVASREAATELDRFIAEHFRPC